MTTITKLPDPVAGGSKPRTAEKRSGPAADAALATSGSPCCSSSRP
ncbi:hypothetical protein PJ267_17455 [Arthrobacter sp. OVS8]|nr:hypothetical protein PJ267_17455 [Arthrobacter sp. OVS8]